jgi:hypothetical protein
MQIKLGLCLTSLLIISMAIALVPHEAKASSWQTVKNYQGYANDDATIDFTITAPVWRVHWSYSPENSYVYLGTVTTNESQSPAPMVNELNLKLESEYITSGTIDMWGTGTYKMLTFPANMYSYTILIEQDMDSIPTSTPAPLMAAVGGMTIWIVIGVVVAIVIAVVALVAVRKSHQNNLPPPPPPGQ